MQIPAIAARRTKRDRPRAGAFCVEIVTSAHHPCSREYRELLAQLAHALVSQSGEPSEMLKTFVVKRSDDVLCDSFPTTADRPMKGGEKIPLLPF